MNTDKLAADPRLPSERYATKDIKAEELFI